MGESLRDGPSSLPSTIPLFPLPNAVLFPGVPLPLHIFEPRYREMVRDAERSPDRLIGMVLLRGDWRKDYYGSPDVFPLGCAGRMVNVDPLADGRYNIVLHGVREFEIQSENRDRSYRRAEVVWRPAASEALQPSLREQIQGAVREYLRDRSSNLPGKLLADPSVPDDLLVNFLCYALDIPPLEKQALLDAPGPSARGSRLYEAIQFALKAGGFSGESDEWRH
jgi:Lon protease-like protein